MALEDLRQSENAFVQLDDYDQFPLPKFSASEKLLHELKLTPSKELLDQVAETETQSSETLDLIDRLTGTFAIQQVSSYLEHDPELLTQVKQVVKNTDWTGVVSDSPRKFVLLEMKVKINQLKFALVQNWLEHAAGKSGLTEVAEIEYRQLAPAMAAIDKLYLKIQLEDFPLNSHEREQHGLINEFAIVRKNPTGEIAEIPLDKAYPEEIQIILNSYESLITALAALAKSTDPSLQALSDNKLSYYRTVHEAFRSNTAAAWLAADRFFAAQVIVSHRDTIHIHSMEHYGKDAILRSPEISLRTPLVEHTTLNEACSNAIDTIIHSLTHSDLQNCVGTEIYAQRLQRIKMTIRHFLGAGYRTEKACAGQCIPNTTEGRQYGIDGSLNINTLETQFREGKQRLIDVFGERFWREAVKDIGEEPSLASFLVNFLISHEVGHLAGKKDIEVWGGKVLVGPYAEEFKATTSVIPGLYIPYKQGLVEFNELQKLILFIISETCRVATIRHLSFGAFYFRESMLLMKIVEEAGLIVRNGPAWEINLNNRENIFNFYENLLAHFKRLMIIFENGDENGLRDYLQENLQTTPCLEFVCETILVQNNTSFTPEKLAVLPPKSMRPQTKDVLVPSAPSTT